MGPVNLPRIRRPRWLYVRNDQGRIRLSWLVAIGTVTVVMAGGALFLWFAWLLSRQPASWTAWLIYVDGQGWFDAAETTAVILAIVGVSGAALVAYRRQDTAERTHNLESERHQDDRERELRSRFTTIAEQLSGKSAVRLAGAYALAALADDWHRFGSGNERQVCVDLLCAQLRRKPMVNDSDDDEFRRTVIAIIKQHRPKTPDPQNVSDWRSCKLDLRGADLSDSTLWTTNFADVNLDGAKLRHAGLVNACLVGAHLKDANLRGANLLGADLTRASLSYADLTEAGITRANLTEAQVYGADLTGADLSKSDLTGTVLNGSNLTGAKLTGAKLENARMGDIIYDDQTVWPPGFEPPPSPSR
jgi:uncharacterized protein YjbI with pentapeptide repeats